MRNENTSPNEAIVAPPVASETSTTSPNEAIVAPPVASETSTAKQSDVKEPVVHSRQSEAGNVPTCFWIGNWKVIEKYQNSFMVEYLISSEFETVFFLWR